MKIGLHNNGVEIIEHYHEIAHADALFRQLIEPSAEQTKCAHFGCGRTLTLEERLCGNRCKDHQKTSEVDVTRFVSY